MQAQREKLFTHSLPLAKDYLSSIYPECSTCIVTFSKSVDRNSMTTMISAIATQNKVNDIL